jgi:hypothetical protein
MHSRCKCITCHTPAEARGTVDKLLAELRQSFHQAALAASGIVLVDDTLPSSNVELGDGGLNGFGRSFLIALGQFHTGFLHEGSGAATIDTVAQSPFLILFIALDRRLDISQSTYPPKSYCKTDASLACRTERNDTLGGAQVVEG